MHEEIKNANRAAAAGHAALSISNINVTMYIKMSEPWGSATQGRKAKWQFYRN